MSGFSGVVRFRPKPHLRFEGESFASEGDATLLVDGRPLLNERPVTATRLLELFQSEGVELVDRLRGDFAIAVWTGAQLVLLRDHVGARTVFYARVGEGVTFATSLRALGLERDIDRAQIALFVAGLAHLDEASTPQRGARRVPARGRITIDAENISEERWLAWEDVPRGRAPSTDAWVAEFSEIFERAVERAWGSGERVGSLLSGGLDSSSVATTLGAQLGSRGAGPLDTFSARFPRSPSSDEGDYSAAVAALDGIRSHDVDVDPLPPFGTDVLAHIAARDEPCYGANLYVNLALARCADETGVDVLFDGVDGDSIMGYGFERLAGLAVRGRWLALFAESGRTAERVEMTRAALLRSEVFAPLRSRVAGLAPAAVRRGLRRARGRSTVDPIFRDDMLEETGVRAELERRSLRSGTLSARASVEEGLATGFNGSILELLDGALAPHGIRGAYPYFDRDLIEFSLGMPDDLRLRDGWTRWIQRQAGRRLPERIRWRPWKRLLGRSFADSLHFHHEPLLKRLDDPALPLFSWIRHEPVMLVRDRFLVSKRVSDASFLGKVLAVSCWLEPNSLS